MTEQLPPSASLPAPGGPRILRSSILWRLYAGFALVILLVSSSVGLLAGRFVERETLREVDRELEDEARLLHSLASSALESEDGRLQGRVAEIGQELSTRLTVIAVTGLVLADSSEDPARMDNHATRPEVLAAGSRSVGRATRFSHTVKQRMRYFAMPLRLDGGRVDEHYGWVRTALPLTQLEERLATLRRLVLLGAILGALVGLLVGVLLARHLTRPLAMLTESVEAIARGAYGRRVPIGSSDEIGRLGEAFNTMSTQLRRLESMRRDFVGNVSHELKTPVTAIRGLVETLVEDPDAPPPIRRRFLGKALRQAERLSNLVTDLLSLSRLESHEHPLELFVLDVRDVLDEVAHAQQPNAEARGVRIERAWPENEALWIDGEEEALRQAVGNLLSNAIKYSPEGGVVRLGAMAEDGDIVLRVRDDGPGIDPRHHPRLFERFYRVDAARSRELGGTGLGLAIVKHIAMALSGDVGVDSAVGKGSTFWIRLPRATP